MMTLSVSWFLHQHPLILLFFTQQGRVYKSEKVMKFRIWSLQPKLPVVNLLKLDEGESIKLSLMLKSEHGDDASSF